MNSRRKFLTFLGLAPVAVATGAVAATTKEKTVLGLTVRDSNVGEIIAGSTQPVVGPLKESEIVWDRCDEVHNFAQTYRKAKARRLI